MAGPLRFRTPHIEELVTAQIRQAPGFAWIPVSGPPAGDPSRNWGTTNRKRQRNSAFGQTDSQREAQSARQQRETERKIRELNSEGTRDVVIPAVKEKTAGGAPVRAGKTPNTKKILASGKTLAHYLDDEEAEIARTGRREGDVEAAPPQAQRPSKTPIARRKPSVMVKEESSLSSSPAPPGPATAILGGSNVPIDLTDVDGDTKEEDEEELEPLPPLPTQAEMEALMNAPPLTYNQARSAPPPASAPPPRRFCEMCGYWGRVRCMKCGNMTCSVLCKDAHDEHKCLKFYA